MGRTSTWPAELEAARAVLLRYGVSDADVRAAVEAALGEVRGRVEALTVKSDYDNEAWLDRSDVLDALTL
jgi:hypothetical protein